MALADPFFPSTLRPLSPPDSPFNFGAAFSAEKPPASSPPASPHFALPDRVKSAAASPHAKRARGWAKTVLQRSEENPYFPSIEEQKRAERWARDAVRMRLPVESPPAAADAAALGKPAPAASPADGEVLGKDTPAMKLDLSDVRRRRALRICVARGGECAGAVLPPSPPGLEPEVGMEGEMEYRRGMAVHLRERISRRSVRPRSWGKDGFEW